MDTNKMREQFEAWWEDNKYFMFGTRKVSKGDCFYIWQASREAVVVELPAERRIRHAPMPDENGSYNEALENCRDAIEAQGLKVKL